MDQTNLINLFKEFRCTDDTSQPNGGVFSIIPVRSLVDAQQFANRNSAGWKTAQYIVIDDSDRNQLETILDKWKILAKDYDNQFLLVFDQLESKYKIYKNDGSFLGDDSILDSLIKKNKKIDNSVSTEFEDMIINGTNTDEIGYNKIIYGAPGCGKSYDVDQKWRNDICIKTTFFPDYTYSDFVGQIMPCLDKNNKPTYKFFKGPFTNALIEAFNNPERKVALIIDEINRGNAAAIFGNIFQLLDRDTDGSSRYYIDDENIVKELNENVTNKNENFKHVNIPKNLFIIGTMNTSDQNVFPLDTAFQRRWQMHKIMNTFVDKENNYVSEKAKILAEMYIPKTNITYIKFVEIINRKIISSNIGLNSEDKQIGIYFLSERELSIEPNSDCNYENFAEKMLKYLWDDAAKVDRASFFPSSCKSLDDVILLYETNTSMITNKLGLTIIGEELDAE